MFSLKGRENLKSTAEAQTFHFWWILDYSFGAGAWGKANIVVQINLISNSLQA